MTNIIQFPVPGTRQPAPTPLPTFLDGWETFLKLVELEDIEALPIRGRATPEGPQIEFNGKFIEPDEFEYWDTAILWLTPCVMQIAGGALAESLAAPDGIGRFSSPRWESFRAAVAKHTTMEWPEIIKAARREGVDFIADHIAASLLVESSLVDLIQSA